MLLRPLTFALVAVIFAGTSVNASPIFFNDRTAFTAALGGTALSLESFEGVFLGTGSVMIFPSGITVIGDEHLLAINPSTVPTDGVATIGIIDNSFNGNLVTFMFDSPINAFSLDVRTAIDFGAGGVVQLSNDNGASQALYSGVLPTFQIAFVGLIDTTPFTSVSVATTLAGDGIQLDRLEYGTITKTPPIPEPSTLLLMGSGVISAAVRRYRKRRC